MQSTEGKIKREGNDIGGLKQREKKNE